MSNASEPHTANQLPVPTSAAQQKSQYSVTFKSKLAWVGFVWTIQLSAEVTEKPRLFGAGIQLCQQLGLFTLEMGVFTHCTRAGLSKLHCPHGFNGSTPHLALILSNSGWRGSARPIFLLLDEGEVWIIKTKLVRKLWTAGIVCIKMAQCLHLPLHRKAVLLLLSLQRNNIPWSGETGTDWKKKSQLVWWLN